LLFFAKGVSSKPYIYLFKKCYRIKAFAYKIVDHSIPIIYDVAIMNRDTSAINVFKYCMKCGSTRFKGNREYLFVCPDCNLHFHINSSAAIAAIILNQSGEILLTKRANPPAKGALDLPGGFVAVNESAECALKREIYEELNITIKEAKYFTSYPNEYVYRGLSYYTTDLFFICTIKDIENIKIDKELAGYIFINPDKLNLDEIGFDSIRRGLADYIKSRKIQA
jgi:NAD+ diphosphatase